MDVIHKIGRRKTAVARVYLSKGKGNITVLPYCNFTIQSKSAISID